MKLAICSTMVPFVNGGYRNIAEWLAKALEQAGHKVELIYLPQVDNHEAIVRQMASLRLIDLSSADRIICLRPQSHFIQHDQKIVWFIHHLRLLYDLWDSKFRDFPETAKVVGIRDAVRDLDRVALREATGIFANSKVTAKRLQEYNGLESEVLYPPLWDSDRFSSTGQNNEIVSICRLEPHKRQELLIDALALTKRDVRVRICGLSSSNAYYQKLRKKVNRLGLRDRVTFDHRWISEEEKSTILGQCLAAYYAPVDEDSYGYPVLEAGFAGKPVLTTADAGGVLELIENKQNGLVVEPDAAELASAMDDMERRRTLTTRMGNRGPERIAALGISWERVVERLLA